METSSSSRITRRTYLLAALVIVTTIKLYLALKSKGSLDVPAFADQMEKVRELGVEAYRVPGIIGNPLNHPPPMLHVFRFWWWLTANTSIPFRFWFRLPAVLADIGSFVIVSRWLQRFQPNRDHFFALLALVLCPASILISGYHGNTDPVMILFVLFSLYLVETGQSPALAGVVFGLAMGIKIVPLALSPAAFFYLHGKRKFSFFGAAGVTFLVLSLPFLIQDPKAIISSVFFYQSSYGEWGWTLLARLKLPMVYLHSQYEPQGIHATIGRVLKFVTLGAMVAASFWANRKENASLMVIVGFVLSLFLFLTPGFGVQYLAWLVPFVVLLGLRIALVYYLTSGLFLVWSYFGVFGSSPAFALAVHLICWLSLLVVVFAFKRRITSPPST